MGGTSITSDADPFRLATVSIYLHGMTSQSLQRRQLGANGPVVFPLALGCMGMSDFYGPADEAESIATIHAALDAGITLLDTGDDYAAGRNELLIGRSAAPCRRCAYRRSRAAIDRGRHPLRRTPDAGSR